MEPFEIDNIEVSNSSIELTYWLSGHKKSQSIIFRIEDFEKWLLDERKISISAYWDHWDLQDFVKPSNQLFVEDMKSYLAYRIGMFNIKSSRAVISDTERKPMTRVSNSSSASKGKSA